MRRLLVVCTLLLCSCGAQKITSEVVRSDSTLMLRVEREHITVRDTLELRPLPPSSQRDRLYVFTEALAGCRLRPQTSTLSNEYCISVAAIGEDGWLTHTLTSKPSAMLPTRYVTTLRMQLDSMRLSAEQSRVVVREKREKYITWWQRTQIIGFWVVIGTIIIANRKKIMNTISLWRI